MAETSATRAEKAPASRNTHRRLCFVCAVWVVLVAAPVRWARAAAVDSTHAASKDLELTAQASGDSVSTPPKTEQVRQRDAFDLLSQALGRDRHEPAAEAASATGFGWALLPTFSYNPVYGAAFGAVISGAGRRGFAAEHYSSLILAANVSTKGQIQFQVRGDVFTASEDYLLKADFRYLDTERSTWGLGPLEDQQDEYPMSFLLNRAYATTLRRVSGPVYLGFGFHLDDFSNIVDQRAANGESTPFVEYSNGLLSTTRAVGLSINLLADTRDNVVNPKRGSYLSWSFRDYLETFGSDANWQELLVEARLYPHVPKHSRNVLAFWLSGWLTFGPAPYLNLPSNGWDTYGRGARGYLAGRIRGANQIYLESEYRWSLTRDGLWGAVVFLNATSTTRTETGTFARMDLAAGAGLRMKFNKNTDTNLAVDYGRGTNGSDGIFFGMTEVF